MAAAWQVLARSDAELAAVIRMVGPCALEPSLNPPYESLLSAIAHQQLHGVAARAILGRLAALDGGQQLPSPAVLLACPDERLRAVGLSRSKLAAMRDVAARTIDGTVPDLTAMSAMDDEAIIERLVAVRGVGRWTAQMLLISTLGRPDVMPADDYGVRLGYQWAFGLAELPKPRELLAGTERFAPFRSTVALYFWRYVDLRRASGTAPAAVPPAVGPTGRKPKAKAKAKAKTTARAKPTAGAREKAGRRPTIASPAKVATAGRKTGATKVAPRR